VTYETETVKTEMSGFAELFEISVANVIYYYTSYANNITFGGQEYVSKPLQRSPFNVDQQFRAITVTISAPLIFPMTQYIANTPLEPVIIKIYRAFLSDLTAFRLVFSGIIKTVDIEDKVARATCESLSDVLRTKIPNVLYQAYCNHRVFDPGCKLNQEDFRTAATVTVTASTLVSAAFAAKPNGYFTGGHVVADTDFRLITNHFTSTITLQVPFDARVYTGSIIVAYPGCNLSPVTCRDKFSNLDNYLGMPYIPSKNPAVSGFG